MKRRQQGLSLLELLMVMALLALATAVLLPRWSHTGARGIQAQADSLRTALQTARLQAMASGRPQRFVWSPQTRQWRTAQTDGRIPDDIAVTLTYGQAMDGSAHEPAIEFKPDGLSSGGRLELRRGDRSEYLEVDWLTGQVQQGSTNR